MNERYVLGGIIPRWRRLRLSASSGFSVVASLDIRSLRLATISKRNELLARARRRGNFVVSDVLPLWSTVKVSLYEHVTATERRAFNEAKQLARNHRVRYVWMRWEVTYFWLTGSPSMRYISSDSILREVGADANRQRLFDSSPQAASDGGRPVLTLTCFCISIDSVARHLRSLMSLLSLRQIVDSPTRVHVRIYSELNLDIA